MVLILLFWVVATTPAMAAPAPMPAAIASEGFANPQNDQQQELQLQNSYQQKLHWRSSSGGA